MEQHFGGGFGGGFGRAAELTGYPTNPVDVGQFRTQNAKQQIINMLLARGMQPNKGEMVGRFYVPQSWAQDLSSLAQVGVGMGGQYLQDKDITENAKAKQDAMANAVKQYTQDLAAARQPTAVQGPDVTTPSNLDALMAASALGAPPAAPDAQQVDPNAPPALRRPPAQSPGIMGVSQALVDQQQVPPSTGFAASRPPAPPPPPAAPPMAYQPPLTTPGATTMQPADPRQAEEVMRAGMMNPDNPFLRQTAGVDYQTIQSEKEKDANREFLGAQRDMDRQNRIETAIIGFDKSMALALASGATKETIEKMKEDQEKLITTIREEGQDRRDNVQPLVVPDKQSSTGYSYHDARTQKKLMEAPVPSAEVSAAAKGAKGRALPGSIGQKFIENSQNMRMAENALALISGKTVAGAKGDPNATGMKGYLPDAILQRIDPSGVDTRAAVANLGSMIIHDRSGAAVTAAEYPRLRPFIPSDKDLPDTVKKKLTQFVNEYQKIMQEMTDFYTESGYTVPTSNWHQSSTETAPAAAPSGTGTVRKYNPATGKIE